MSNDRPLIFVDLDDTLFQTARKTPANIENMSQRWISAVTPMAT